MNLKMNKCSECSSSCGHKSQIQENNTDYFVKFFYGIERKEDLDQYENVESKLTALPGVKGVIFNKNNIEILYDDLLITTEDINKTIKNNCI